MNKIYKFTLLFCLLFVAVQAFAASEAEYKKIEKTYKLNADGSQEFRCNIELTLYTHMAMNSVYGETFIVYNPEYQKLQIHSSYTKQKDGKIIKTPNNAFVEVLPHNATNAPAYNNLKEMVVVHTGLEIGATIYLDYSIISKPEFSPELDIYEEPLQSSPVKSYTLTVITPQVKELNYTLKNNNTNVIEKITGDNRTSIWRFTNLPAVSHDPLVSVVNGDQPFFVATTYASTSDALATLYKQFDRKNNIQLSTIAEGLVEGKSSDKDKLAAIMDFVTTHIDNNSLNIEETSYRLRPAEDVLSTAYGTDIEKTNVLAGLLISAGFDAEPAVLYKINANNGLALNAIDQIFVVCKADDGKQYLFTTNSNRISKAAFLNGIAPVYSLSTGKKINISSLTDYQIKSQVLISFNNDKLITKVQTVTGSDIRPYFSESKKESTVSEALSMNNGYATIELTEPINSFANFHFGRLNSIRKENLLLPRLVDEEYSYEVQLPDGLALQTPITNRIISNAAGKMLYVVKKEGNKALITRNLQLNKQLYTPAGYSALRALMTEWGNINNRTLVFKKQ
ncbi:MAG: DUF3857 domain-containing protein [Parabacteroides sp.]|nr:DUF3857 domain-containing protein [Parabacteroides sp.]